MTRTTRRILVTAGCLFGLLLAYLLLWPVSIDPLAFEPAPPPAREGAYAANQALASAERLGENAVSGPEDVAVDPAGRIYVGTHDGRILRLGPDGEDAETFANTGGRPLGLAWDREGNLIVADAVRGLLSVAPDGTVAVLTSEADGRPFRFTDDVDVAEDGRIYFSDASDRFGYGDHILDLLEARPHGRLLRYDPTTKRTETLLDGLYFANGVAIAKDQRFVLVNETYRFRVTRYWLSDERAGSHEIVIDNLPGYPDGISCGPRGTFWVALFTVRNARAEWLAPRPFAKKAVARLPRALWPKPAPYGFALEIDGDGKPLRSLQDPTGATIRTITSIEELPSADGPVLYFGTLHEPYFGRLRLVE
ncbi:MAG: SMP-30/gluconolactonase/LRE family protein [Myxococcales bacterium]|nr:SMP-30/gluconolactonase/LRE family protein [Myxococcales bacterium]